MTKRVLIVFILITLLAGNVFAQTEESYKMGDMFIGLDLGAGFTPNIFKALSAEEIRIGDYAVAFDFGFNFDYYLSDWLSINSGIFARPGIYLLLDKILYLDDDSEFTDFAKTPVTLTFPLMAHVNVPSVSWLYLGLGLNLNIPIKSMLDDVLLDDDFDTKGKFFLGIPIDIGFDFVKANKGGGRFMFRITPEIHKGGGTPVLYGVMWQLYNIRVNPKR